MARAKGAVPRPRWQWMMAVENSNIEYDALSSSALVSRSEAVTAMNFDISVPYTVLSDGKTQTVEIQKSEMEALYKYVTVLKLSACVPYGRGCRLGAIRDFLAERPQYISTTAMWELHAECCSVEDTLVLSLG